MPHTILVVDDEEPFRLMLRQLLERYNYRVIEAGDGNGALKVFRTTVPDMVILDMNMPGMSGLEICKMFRQDPYGGSIPIIFLSGCGGVDDIVKGIEGGANDYIRKPFEINELLARIKMQLSWRPAFDAKRWGNGQFRPGTVIEGDIGEQYKIESLLATGGMGVIFLGHRVSDNTKVVIKTLNSSFLNDYKDIQRFLQEANITISLKHPNIAQGLEVVRKPDYCFFVMKFVEGNSLATLLEKNGRISQDFALHIIQQIAAGISHLNSYGLVHRDIKPGNILVDESNNAVLVDLGLAKDSKQPDLTTEGVILGTPYYLSPEQAMGQNLDIRSDIYSLGATFYHAITGMVPFQGSTTIAIINARFLRDPVQPQDLVTEISPQISAIINKMLAHKIEDRFQSPEELLDVLTKVDLTNSSANSATSMGR